MVEVSNFYKSEKTSGQTVRPKKIKTVALIVRYHGRLPSLETIFVDFSVFWAYLVQKLSRSVRGKYFLKIRHDGGENCSAD